jgi:hypothetical protein
LDGHHLWGMGGTAQSVEKARRLVNLPTLGTDFVERVMAAFAEIVPQCDTHTMAFEGDWTGSAWAVLAACADGKTSYVLCVSGFYPIATVRACANLDPGMRWMRIGRSRLLEAHHISMNLWAGSARCAPM